MFLAIYELCPRPGHQEAFAAAWAAFTREIYRSCGSLGSRLHTQVGEAETGAPMIAYAQWPDRATWERAGSENPDYIAARNAMFELLASSRTLFELESHTDLLMRATHDEGRAPARGDAMTASVLYRDPRAAIAWLTRVFGFRTRLVVPDADGGVRHSELVLGSAVLFVGGRADAGDDERAKGPKASPAEPDAVREHDDHTLCIWVADPDAHYRRAVAEGARIVQELRDEHYGARGYVTRDLEGHSFYFSDYVPGDHWTDDDAL